MNGNQITGTDVKCHRNTQVVQNPKTLVLTNTKRAVKINIVFITSDSFNCE